jgi:EpsD family peptidyl-prolyl cis-trans isomerase
MKTRLGLVLIATACIPIAACHIPGLKGKPKAPTGQVVAVVGDQEITARELNAEMPNLNTTDAKIRRAVQDQVLESIIGRKILADAARKAGVEKSADYVMVRKRAEETLLVQGLQKQMADAVPAPTDDEVSQFVSTNPNLFREHKVFVVEQIRTQGSLPAQVLKKLEPLKTLDEVVSVLQAEKIQFARGGTQLDSLALGPEITALALKVGPSDLFVLPGSQVTLINHLIDIKTAALTGDDAKKVATEYLKAHHTKDAVQRGLAADMKAGGATVAFNPAYKPAAQAPAAPAPGAVPADGLKK